MSRDGWHTVCGYKVYIENGLIIRGIVDGRTVYVYGWDNRLKVWNRENVTPSVFRYGMIHGTIILA